MSTKSLDDILDSMTLEEQVSLLSGADFWTTPSVDRLGIPAIKVTDGPNGARGDGPLIGGIKAACFPAGIAIGASWNPELAHEIGQALAEEAKAKGANVLLAPTINIERSGLNGRNFECYSEDPFLTARLAVGYINGVQSQGVGATAKHFVGNESEIQRTTMSSNISDRALREIYFPPFEAAVKEAGVMAVMSSYNRLNGTYTSEYRQLLTDVLKEEWGFDGIVMSDWYGSCTTVETMEGGLDLEMPGPDRDRGDKLVKAVEDGLVSRETVRAAAKRMLRLIERVRGFDAPDIPEERAVDTPSHRALIRRAGAEGTVLLKNDGILPLDMEGLSIAAIGPNADIAQIMGGGSAQLNPHYSVSPQEGLQAILSSDNQLRVASACTNYRLMPLIMGPAKVEIFAKPDFAGPVVRVEDDHLKSEMTWEGDVADGVADHDFSMRVLIDYEAKASGEHVFGLVTTGPSRLRIDGELIIDMWENWQPGDNFFESGNDESRAAIALEKGQNIKIEVDYRFETSSAINIKGVRVGVDIPLGDQAIEEAVAMAETSDVAILYVGRSGEWDTEGNDLPNMNLPGRQDELVERIAAVNSKTIVVLQTGGPVMMPWLDKVSAVLQSWYPGQEAGNAITDVLTGRAEPGGRLAQTFPMQLEDMPVMTGDPATYPGKDGHVDYREDIMVGYRHFDNGQINPLFPFGFGLSYTKFKWGALSLNQAELDESKTIEVRVPVTNVGERAGYEVVQVYMAAPKSDVVRAPKELKGFAKLFIKPGETVEAEIALDIKSFACFDEQSNAWITDVGEYRIIAAASALDTRSEATVTVSRSWSKAVSGRIS